MDNGWMDDPMHWGIGLNGIGTDGQVTYLMMETCLPIIVNVRVTNRDDGHRNIDRCYLYSIEGILFAEQT